jgi:hypothetical protein
MRRDETSREDLARERVELKYLLLEGEAEDLRSRLEGALGDPAFRKEDGWIATVYLDRPDGSLAREALRNPRESLKLRLREYFTPRGVPLSPFVWIEIKERQGWASRKSRFQIPRRSVEPFLGGELDPGEVLSCRTRPRRALEAARRLREIAGGPLVPMGAVRYRRLAVEGGSPRARLTIDREVAYHPGPVGLYACGGELEVGAPAATEESGGIAELKYAGERPPGWCERALAEHRPSDYSKFLVLAALALPKDGREPGPSVTFAEVERRLS